MLPSLTQWHWASRLLRWGESRWRGHLTVKLYKCQGLIFWYFDIDLRHWGWSCVFTVHSLTLNVTPGPGSKHLDIWACDGKCWTESQKVKFVKRRKHLLNQLQHNSSWAASRPWRVPRDACTRLIAAVCSNDAKKISGCVTSWMEKSNGRL